MGGVVEVVLMPGKKLEHLGIKIELVGTIGTRVFACIFAFLR